MSSKILILLALVFAGVAGAFFWVWNGNTFSKEVLRVEVLGPAEAAAGEEVEYVVTLKNNGNVSLERASLVFEYPDRTIPREGEDVRVRREVEELYPGREASFSFFGRLMGSAGEVRKARALVSYAPKNLEAAYESEAEKATRISSVPLNFEFDLPSRMEGGQEFGFAVNYFSHASSSFSDLRLKVEYPEGFRLKRALPESVGDSEWEIGQLERGQGGRIDIRGMLEGPVGSMRTFRAEIGRWHDGTFTKLAAASENVEIARPRLLITQMVNGMDRPVAAPGEDLHYVVSFKNISGKRLSDLFLAVTLEGEMFDLGSIRSPLGSVPPGDNVVIWETEDLPALSSLGAGEGGMAEFWVKLKHAEDVAAETRNPVLRDRVVLSDVQEEFEIKVSADLSFRQTLERGYQDIQARGPIPPRDGEETTFVVVWEADASLNGLDSAKARASLAPGVEMTGIFAPENAAITYDSGSREVVWDAGSLPARREPEGAPVRVAFQISLRPEQGSAGQDVPLIGEARMEASDAFAQTEIEASSPALSTGSGAGGGVAQGKRME